MKILFLDFDGVLNHRGMKGAWLENGGVELVVNPECMARLNRVVGKSGANVVVSSTWRKFRDLSGLRSTLAAAGFQYGERVIATTPVLNTDRALEIASWLLTAEEDVEEYAIVDDDHDAALGGRFVPVSFEVGLQDNQAEALLALLNGPPPEEAG